MKLKKEKKVKVYYNYMSVISTHNAGFFSCCSIKLNEITGYINGHSKIPDYVDSSEQFNWYKYKEGDITYDYFEHYDNINVDISYPIKYNHDDQFINYSNVDYKNITPVIHKYFSPSAEIRSIIKNMEEKYLFDYENICVLYYRGNDKNRETKICGYDEYIVYCDKILKENPTILFLIQTDETEFIDFITTRYANSFYCKDEIRHMNKCNSTVDIVMRDKNYEFSKYYLAITIIMSKCKYIVCGSGNCSIWIMLYRGNSNYVYQNLNNEWLA